MTLNPRTTFAVLAEDFKKRLIAHSDDSALTRDELLGYYQQEVLKELKTTSLPKGYLGDVYRWWPHIMRGHAAPWHVVSNFVRMVRSVLGWVEADPNTACHLVPAPVHQDAEELWWSWLDVNRTIESFTRSEYSDRHDMWIEGLQRGELLRKAAEMVAYCVGYLTTNPGQPFGRSDCVERGASKMGITLSDYVAWMDALQRKVPASVMFAVFPGKKHQAVRIATCVVLPLTEAAKNRICNREITDFDLTVDDIKDKSPYLLIHAAGIDHEQIANLKENRSKKVSEEAIETAAVASQMHTFMYQEALLASGSRPQVFAAPTNNVYVERLEKAGYRRLGVNNRLEYPLTVLDGGSRETAIVYEHYCGILKSYRVANGWADTTD